MGTSSDCTSQCASILDAFLSPLASLPTGKNTPLISTSLSSDEHPPIISVKDLSVASQDYIALIWAKIESQSSDWPPPIMSDLKLDVETLKALSSLVSLCTVMSVNSMSTILTLLESTHFHGNESLCSALASTLMLLVSKFKVTFEGEEGFKTRLKMLAKSFPIDASSKNKAVASFITALEKLS